MGKIRTSVFVENEALERLEELGKSLGFVKRGKVVLSQVVEYLGLQIAPQILAGKPPKLTRPKKPKIYKESELYLLASEWWLKTGSFEFVFQRLCKVEPLKSWPLEKIEEFAEKCFKRIARNLSLEAAYMYKDEISNSLKSYVSELTRKALIRCNWNVIEALELLSEIITKNLPEEKWKI